MNCAKSPMLMSPPITRRPPKKSISPIAIRNEKSMNEVLEARIRSASMK